MKLQLLSDIVGEDMILVKNSVLNISEATSTNDLPTKLPGDEGKLIPGSIIIGLLGDVTFPFGEDFKKYAGTGWSGHVYAGYSFLNTLQFTLKVGYIKFGEQDVDFSQLAKTTQEEYTQTLTNSQIAILLGIIYTIGLDPSCLGLPNCITGGSLLPYVGFQIGPFFKTWKSIVTLPFYEANKSLQKSAQTSGTTEETESSTIFGIVPTIGAYYGITDKIRLNVGLEYSYLFEEADIGASNINFLSVFAGFGFLLN
jgi:hypothetical protein